MIVSKDEDFSILGSVDSGGPALVGELVVPRTKDADAQDGSCYRSPPRIRSIRWTPKGNPKGRPAPQRRPTGWDCFHSPPSLR